MEDLYREHILDHYENPRHQGEIAGADIVHEETNPLCGDHIRMDVKLSADGTRIEDASFTGDGCIISQASASMLMEDVIGKAVADALATDRQHVLDLVGAPLTPSRMKCALLGLKVMKTGLANWRLARGESSGLA